MKLADRLRAFPEVSALTMRLSTDEERREALKEAAHLIASAADVMGVAPSIRSALLGACVADIQACWARADRLDEMR